MKTNNKKPPTLGIALLEHTLPESIKDDVIGDLHEQYYESKDTLLIKQWEFYKQVLLIILRYVMITKQALSLVCAILALSVFFVVTAGILFLSNNNDAEAFTKPYWTDGNFYQFFLDPMLYQSISLELFTGVSPQLFINIPAILWVLLGAGAVFLMSRASKLNLQSIAALSVILLAGPYIWGMISFKTNHIPLVESGPIIAFSLITVSYLVIPLTVLFIKELLR
ncbi:hypothetical protein KJ365_00400 [Glaciecola sp. XM2]|jgi:hypothetical protein|uniref:hypothetical protein n=1 Tax=Glaciecola sp. XM2 TaxID=1914931 RepID=UPI001BDF3693|nr:hypothetical protein [Glaciecola sp. XM2]MBT1449325.1 hypothetical protein [Glaciecola sp. XM2]